MQATVLKRRTTLGAEDAGEVTGPRGVLKPIVDKVGVPLMWFGIGYVVCMVMSARKVRA